MLAFSLAIDVRHIPTAQVLNMFKLIKLAPLLLFVGLWCGGGASAEGLLDGRVFKGMIGPVEAPDFADSLHFEDGHFWSDICTRCGFLPGEYHAEMTDEGIVFRGTLNSDSRGRFDYDGLVRDQGAIEVAIRWERKRWYWTSSREIAFQGTATEEFDPLTLNQIRLKLDDIDPSENPLCARF